MIWLGLMLFSLCIIAAHCIDQWFELRQSRAEAVRVYEETIGRKEREP